MEFCGAAADLGRVTGNPEVMWHVPRGGDCVQLVYKKAGLKGLKMDLSKRRINNRLLSYRPKSKNNLRILAGERGPVQLRPHRRMLE